MFGRKGIKMLFCLGVSIGVSTLLAIALGIERSRASFLQTQLEDLEAQSMALSRLALANSQDWRDLLTEMRGQLSAARTKRDMFRNELEKLKAPKRRGRKPKGEA